MCILFIHTEDSGDPYKYKLILASNRDEAYKRPAREAHYWEEDNKVFGGRDMEPGREGGTWLAMSTTGKIGILLNILMPTVYPNSKGRGCLVANYVKSSAFSGMDYLNNVKNEGSLYNLFNMVAIDIREKTVQVSHYGEGNPENLKGGTLAFGNSSFKKPFQKVVEGKKSFKSIVEKHGVRNNKEILIEELIHFLKCETSYHPDEMVHELAPDLPVDKQKMYSSIYVKSPKLDYGTRTHTVILIDHENQVDFVEWTMEEPIDPTNPKWKKTRTNFKIKV